MTQLTAVLSKAEALKSTLQRETVKQLQGSVSDKKLAQRISEGESAVAHGLNATDNPEAFVFDCTEGVIPGQSAERQIAELKITFKPLGTACFESCFAIEVEGGRGCEVTLKGRSEDTEYGRVARGTAKIVNH